VNKYYKQHKNFGPIFTSPLGIFLVTYLANKETAYSNVTLMCVDGSQWLCGLRRWSVAALLLAVWVRILLG
jgi:hypothetical protein